MAAGIALLLAALTLAVYEPVARCGFVNLDDPVYVTEQPRVREGLSWSGVLWAFRTPVAGLWHPVTLLSHMTDCALFGLQPAGHHLMSLALHVVNVELLFAVLLAMTGAPWPSALAAALFAVHPLKVDSVAWIAERKNVLSTLFWLLAVGAYVRWTRRPGARRWAGVAALMATGLLAKPMLVALPFALLLLDGWPLRRLNGSDGRQALDRLREKWTIFLLAALFSIVAVWAQRSAGAVVPGEVFPWPVRAGYVADNYVHYLRKMMWPSALAAVYPMPRSALPAGRLVFDLAVLLGATLLAWSGRRTRPYVLAGWLWYLVTLLPVSGIVTLGLAIRADRYAYVPMIGLLVAGAWRAAEAAARSAGARCLVAGLSAAVVIGLSAASHRQVGTWRDSITLYRHAIAVTRGNDVALTNLGIALDDGGRTDEAMRCYGEALRINPDNARAHYQVGKALGPMGRLREAETHLNRAIELKLQFAPAWLNLGVVYRLEGRTEEAIRCFRDGLALDPRNAQAKRDLEALLAPRKEAGGY